MTRRRAQDPLFDEPQQTPWMKWALIACVVIIIGFVLYVTLSGPRAPQGPVPLIRADETPWTRAPSEAGGMDIPNQDSTVFELMDKPDETTATTSPEELPEGTVAKTDDKPTLDAIVDEAMKPEDTAATAPVIGDEKTDEKAADVKPVATPADTKTVTTTEVKTETKLAKPEDEPAPIPVKTKTVETKTTTSSTTTPATPAPKTDRVRVRLGAMPGTDQSLAAKEFARLQGLSGGQLSGYSASYEPVTLAKGSFVRINVGMERAQAAKLCDTLSAKGAPCLILEQ